MRQFEGAPFLRRTDSTAHMSIVMLVGLLPLCIFSCVYFGYRPALVVLISMAAAFVSELICLLVAHRPLRTVLDGTALVTGGIIGCVMSPTVPYWVPVVAAVFAIVVVKIPFGGLGCNMFNPAAAGVALVSFAFSDVMFRYPSLAQEAPLLQNTNIVIESSLAKQLSTGAASVYPWQDILFGSFPGPIGGTAILVIITCFVYLLLRRLASPLVTLPYLLTCALWAALFPRGGSDIWYYNVMLELCAGYLLFAGVFMLNDPTTRPVNRYARVMYGIAAGILVMVLRQMGRFEEGTCFAILLVNSLSPVFERFGRDIDTLVHTLSEKRKARWNA